MKNLHKNLILLACFLFAVSANCFAQTITTDSIQGNTVCPGSTVYVYFQATGVYNAGNNFTAQLSDASGNWASPTIIGTLVDTTNGDVIMCNIPGNLPAGTGYRIRVVSSSPAVTGTDNGNNLVSGPIVYPTLTLSASTTNACEGQAITFTTTETDGGSSPVYSWEVNNGGYIYSLAGATGATYTSDTLRPGPDTIFCAMISSEACAVGDGSDNVAIYINSSESASVAISAAPGNVICPGSTVIFTTSTTTGGSAPAYQWYLNGAQISGATNSAYTTSTLNNNDEVYCNLTSNNPCASPAEATSNTITMQVTSNLTASVSITSTGTTICQDSLVYFSATAINGGINPTYQWDVNGNFASSSSNNQFSGAFNNGDVVTCIMTSSETCVMGSPATSNGITISVLNQGGAGTITASQDTVCSGSSVTLTITGGTGALQWQETDSVGSYYYVIPGATSASYTTTINGFMIFRVVAGSGNCSAISEPFSVVVLNGIKQGSITGQQTVCTGSTLNYGASNIDNANSYSWAVPAGWSINSGQGTSSVNITASSSPAMGVISFSATNACGTDTLNLAVTTVNSITPSIQIFADSSTSGDTVYACNGNNVSFYATAVNGGASPTYQWQKDGVDAGSNQFFQSNSLATGDSIICMLTSSYTCASPQTVTSSPLYIKVYQNVQPNTIYGNTTVASGSQQTYYVHPSPGVSYQLGVSMGGYKTVSSTDSSITIIVYTDINVYVQENYHCSTAYNDINVSVGPCSAYFTLSPSQDSTQSHLWVATNYAMGTGPITYTWNWGDGSSSNGATPTHTYASAGSYTICLTITDSVGCTSTYCDSSASIYRTDGTPITIEVVFPNGTTTGIEKAPVPNNVTIFPNPSNGNITIATTGNESIKEITITNTLGQVISNIIVSDGNNKTMQVQLPSASGLYFIRMRGEQGEYVNKVVKE